MENKQKRMKILVLGITLVFFVYAAAKWFEKRPVKKDLYCIATVDFDISDPGQLEKYLMDNVWIVTIQKNEVTDPPRGKLIKIKMNDELFFSTWAYAYEDDSQPDKLNNIGNYGALGVSGKIEIKYHDENRKYPYYGEEINFIEIAEDHYTTEFCDESGCTRWKYVKKDIEKVDFDGTYTYKDKTLIIEGENLYHQETDKRYTIHQTDQNRLSISGQIISEMPSYRFWIDEEENIILFSDGHNVCCIEEEKIKADYPFYILVKQKERREK